MDGYLGSSPDQFWSFNNGAPTYPLPDLSDNSTPSLLLGDVTLYTIANFFRQLLNSNLLPRFAEDMLSVGVSNAAFPNYVDGTAVAQVVIYPLYPNILTTTAFSFPLLSVSQTGYQSVQFTTVKTAIKRDFSVSWVMPPMSSAQLMMLQTYLSIVAKTWMGYGGLGYDPKISNTSVWTQAGLACGEITNVTLLPFQGQQSVSQAWQEVQFPAVTLQLSFLEVNQLGLPQNYPNSMSTVSIEVDVVDGYNPSNPLLNFVDGYANPNLTVSSLSVYSGSVQGDTLVFLTGTGFNFSNTYTVSFNGAVSKATSVRSPVILQTITNPAINSQTGLGDIIISDNLGNTFSLNDIWEYTSP